MKKYIWAMLIIFILSIIGSFFEEGAGIFFCGGLSGISILWIFNKITENEG